MSRPRQLAVSSTIEDELKFRNKIPAVGGTTNIRPVKTVFAKTPLFDGWVGLTVAAPKEES
jgi:hypothetical protein